MYYGSLPFAKYVYAGWVLCLVSVRWGFIPALADFATRPLMDTAFGTLTVLSLYTAICLAFASAGAKGNLQRITDACTQTTATTVLLISILVLGFLAAGDLFAAQVLHTDPFVLNTISAFLQDPMSLEDLVRSNVDIANGTIINSTVSGGDI